jgi:hypothetical protein
VALFQTGQQVNYPAYLVSVSFNGSSDPAPVNFWLAAIGQVQDSVGEASYLPASGTGNNALISQGGQLSDYPDAVPSLLSAIKTWAEAQTWAPGVTTKSVQVLLVTGEQTSDVTPT